MLSFQHYLSDDWRGHLPPMAVGSVPGRRPSIRLQLSLLCVGSAQPHRRIFGPSFWLGNKRVLRVAPGPLPGTHMWPLALCSQCQGRAPRGTANGRGVAPSLFGDRLPNDLDDSLPKHRPLKDTSPPSSCVLDFL